LIKSSRHKNSILMKFNPSTNNSTQQAIIASDDSGLVWPLKAKFLFFFTFFSFQFSENYTVSRWSEFECSSWGMMWKWTKSESRESGFGKTSIVVFVHKTMHFRKQHITFQIKKDACSLKFEPSPSFSFSIVQKSLFLFHHQELIHLQTNQIYKCSLIKKNMDIHIYLRNIPWITILLKQIIIIYIC